jgi:hypothetical protein
MPVERREQVIAVRLGSTGSYCVTRVPLSPHTPILLDEDAQQEGTGARQDGERGPAWTRRAGTETAARASQRGLVVSGLHRTGGHLHRDGGR